MANEESLRHVCRLMIRRQYIILYDTMEDEKSARFNTACTIYYERAASERSDRPAAGQPAAADSAAGCTP